MLGQFLPPRLILRKLLRVDGEGSGLDADKWDGYERSVKPARIFISITNPTVPHKINASDPPTRVVLAEGDLPSDFFILTDIVLFGSHEPKDTGEPEPWYDADVDFETGKIRVYGYNNSTSVDYTFSGTFVLNYLAGEHVVEPGTVPTTQELTYTIDTPTQLAPGEEIRWPAYILFPTAPNIELSDVSVEYTNFQPAGYEDQLEVTTNYDDTTALLELILKNNHTDTVSFDSATFTIRYDYNSFEAPWKYLYVVVLGSLGVSIPPGESREFRRQISDLSVEQGEVVKRFIATPSDWETIETLGVQVNWTFDNETKEVVATLTNTGSDTVNIDALHLVAGVLLKLSDYTFNEGESVFESVHGTVSARWYDTHDLNIGIPFAHIDYFEMRLREWDSRLQVSFRHDTDESVLHVRIVNPTTDAPIYEARDIKVRYIYI